MIFELTIECFAKYSSKVVLALVCKEIATLDLLPFVELLLCSVKHIGHGKVALKCLSGV